MMNRAVWLKSQEDHGATGLLNITWYYNKKEEAVRAEKDTRGDGRIDTWYYYQEGSVRRVEEDKNADGRPDLWEEYDTSEALTKRSQDLDCDGKPDIVEEPEAGE